MYHPALGLYEPKKMLYIRNDWMALGRYLAGAPIVVADAFPDPDYREVTEADEILDLDPTRPLAADTESGREGPFCLTYSQEPGTGRLIRADAVGLMEVFQERIADWQAPILFHNWLYDWTITEAMGLQFPRGRVLDTMALVYLLGNLPQGLKALAYRYLGMVMHDFEDVVKPHSTKRVLDYYLEASCHAWPKPDPELVRDVETGLWKLYKPQSMNTKLKRFMADYRKNPDKNVFEMWTENWTDSQAMIEAEIGPWPGMDIRHVPFDEALFYACRDSDALIRLWYDVLVPARARVRKRPQDRWLERRIA